MTDPGGAAEPAAEAVKDTSPCWIRLLIETGLGVAVNVTGTDDWSLTLTTMVEVPVMPGRR